MNLDSDICFHCGAEFEQYPGERKEPVSLSHLKNDTFRLIGIISIFFSISLFAIALLISEFHKWVMPISENPIPYIIVFLAGIILATIAYDLNSDSSNRGMRLSQNRRLLPFAVFLISVIGATMILSADLFDMILGASHFYPYLFLIAIFSAGAFLYLKSDDSKREHGILNIGNPGAKRRAS